MNTKLCPICQAPIPAHAPGGFCPACILREVEEPAPIGQAAPSLAEVAAALPQLEVLEIIGQGGMGFVYKVRQPSLDRIVALKILAPELSRDPAFAERFAREARVLGKLNHPNIVTVFEHGESGGFFYLLMEYVDGVNLRQAMRAGRFTPQQALAIVPGICDALQAAHAQGVWHRDIKPENILLDARGGVKIADFGIARIVGDPACDFTLTATGAALGSAAYMAPEQHEKPHDVDHRADIYSLGVVIYELLTGELPLGRFPAPSERAAVSVRIDEIVHQTLEKERELRQQSAAQVKTDVETSADSPGPGNHERASVPAKDDSDLIQRWGWRLFWPVSILLIFWGSRAWDYWLKACLCGFVASAFLGIRYSRKTGWKFNWKFDGVPEPGSGRRPPAPAVASMIGATRFSPAAIAGASCLLGLVPLVDTARQWANVFPRGFTVMGNLSALFRVNEVFYGAAVALLGTTILGWIAVSQLQHSAGRLRGMGLAVFDGLLFPLLALDYGIAYFLHQAGIALHLWTQNYDETSSAILAVSSIIFWIVLDWLIIRRVWRAVNTPDVGNP